MEKNQSSNNQQLFQKVKVKRAPEIVFDSLQAKILSGEYEVGEKIPSERDLMKIYERSHPTIREALRLLESAGYIEVVPGGGAIVREFADSRLNQPMQELLRFRKVPAQNIVEYLIEVGPSGRSKRDRARGRTTDR